MKRPWLLLVAIGCFLLCVGGGIVMTHLLLGKKASIVSGRIVVLNGDTVNLGLVEEGQYVETAFTLENNGQRSVRIVDVKTGCGCAGATPRKTEIAPGERSVIDVRYTGRDVREQEVLKIWVLTDDIQQPVVELTALAKVKLKVFWYPQSISFYANDEQSILASRVWFLSGCGDVRITKVETSDPSITATAELENGKVCCCVNLVRPIPTGNHTAKVVITAMIDGKTKTVNVPVYIMHPLPVVSKDVDN